jgi:hypothetical protein
VRACPLLDRLPRARAGHLEREQALDLLERLLVHFLRPLRDERDADAEVATELDEPLERAEHLLFARLRILRHELLALLEEEVHRRRRRLLPEEEALGEVRANRAFSAFVSNWLTSSTQLMPRSTMRSAMSAPAVDSSGTSPCSPPNTGIE